MKKILLLTGLFFVLWQTSSAQLSTLPCDSMQIDSVWLQQAGINRLMIRLKLAGNSGNFINYPFFSAVLNQFGDTIARGELFYFGQFGGSVQEYETLSFLNEVPSVMYLVLRYDTLSCSFPYSAATAGQTIEKSRGPLLYPIPAEEEVFISNLASGSFCFLYNSTGGQVAFVSLPDGKGRIPLQELPKGLYRLLLSDGRSAVIIRK
jgi:hypothetical protein